jgi:cell division protein ZapA
MQCNDGEEDHLRELGMVLDAEVNKIKSAVGQVGDIRLLLMTGLVVADRLSETLQRVEELEDQVHGLRKARNDAAKQGEQVSEDVSGRLEVAADRIEALAREIAS